LLKQKDLTEGNLIDALNTHHAPGPGICLHAEQFPIAASRAEIRNAETVGNDPVLTPIPGLEALKSAGLLASHDAPALPAMAPWHNHKLTGMLRPSAHAASGPVPNDSRYGAFCYGHVQVTHVAKWDAEYGRKHGLLQYEMAGLPEWAKRQTFNARSRSRTTRARCRSWQNVLCRHATDEQWLGSKTLDESRRRADGHSCGTAYKIGPDGFTQRGIHLIFVQFSG
jgi:hypothetical protein